MYRPNTAHLQIALFSSVNELPKKQQKELEEGWAGTFYRELFCRIEEEPFGVLYSQEASRPNIAVNVLVGAEVLKAGFGWSDAELEDALHYDVQVRYALGYRDLSEGHFELRTVYNFRRRLSEHMQKEGVNLLEVAFEQVTGGQMEVRSTKLRMDTTQIASNIRETSRIQLLVEVVQRVERMLNEEDRGCYAELLAPYLKGSSGQYVYHLKGEDTHKHPAMIGEVMQRLVGELAEKYEKEPTYQVLKRVYGEHFVEVDSGLRPKMGQELSAQSLQSPDDLEATYREKKGQGYRGYVTNVTETCDPENEVQLIVKVQTAHNGTDDADLLLDALPDLQKRTDVKEIDTDGGFNSADVDEALDKAHIEQFQSAIRGSSPNSQKLGLADFEWVVDEQGTPQQVTCPAGQPADVEAARGEDRYTARFDAEQCEQCPLRDLCPTQPLKRQPQQVLRFSKRDITVARRRRRSRQRPHNLRPAVEATVRSIKHPFRNGKLPVRGLIRVSMTMVASASMVNVRRIWRHQTNQQAEKGSSHTPLTSCLHSVSSAFRSILISYSRLFPIP